MRALRPSDTRIDCLARLMDEREEALELLVHIDPYLASTELLNLLSIRSRTQVRARGVGSDHVLCGGLSSLIPA